MEAPTLQSRFRFPRLSSTPRLCDTHPHQCKVDVPENSPERFHSLTVKKVLRRSVVQFLGLNSILFNVRTVTAATMPETKESDVVR
ncbi:unnamed protein product [Cuscuta campestris]|uniref:Uncharacterized protein n=1 Tax=Cuscuta campestris TaxID=132261 RepID=A0A484NLK6_9ASTE|nr:unnamed protein product [Cuscuta campestris]